MERFITKAITSGLTRGQAYQIWTRAVDLKQQKVFKNLLNRIEQGCDWTEVTTAARIHRLDQAKFLMLKRRYFAYDPT